MTESRYVGEISRGERQAQASPVSSSAPHKASSDCIVPVGLTQRGVP